MAMPWTMLEQPELEKLEEKDKMKLLLAESLISSSLLFHDKPVKAEREELSGLWQNPG